MYEWQDAQSTLVHVLSLPCAFLAGLSSAWVGFCVNIFVTCTLGLAMQYLGKRSRRAAPRDPTTDVTSGELSSSSGNSNTSDSLVHSRHIDIGAKPDPMLRPYVVGAIFLLLLFSVPFYWGTYNSPGYQKPNTWVGNMSAWAFTSLLLSGTCNGTMKSHAHCHHATCLKMAFESLLFLLWHCLACA